MTEIAGTDSAALGECHRIRREVFCIEQGVAEALEWDGLDTTCRHFLIFADGPAAGTARLRPYKPGQAKIERVAVLKRFRGYGLGRLLMIHLIAQARSDGYHEAILNAQIAVRDFYAALGFAAEGPEFEEANIPHVHMRLKLR
ncbi:MAG: GNAT family N-acetyltransferase [Rhodospirillaceae bacterium]|nr:GNAT family N-acetyltransferase [Rhodospirillaceae bacterium]